MELHSTHGIDLTHDTRHLCMRFRIDGIKAMLRGISGGSQNITFAYSSNRSRLYLSDFLATFSFDASSVLDNFFKNDIFTTKIP